MDHIITCDACAARFGVLSATRSRIIGDIQLTALVCPKCHKVYPASATNPAIRDKGAHIASLRASEDPDDIKLADKLFEENRAAIQKLTRKMGSRFAEM